MTAPSLPPFVTRSTRRVYARPVQPTRRPHRTPQPKRSFLDRHGDRITFIWTCILIAALVYTAFS
jgi:hypothetical protein